MTETTRKEILRILNDQLKLNLDPATVSDDQSIQDLGMSSVHLMKLIYVLEDDFGITLGTDQILEIDTLGELVALLESRRAAAGPGAGTSPGLP